MLYVYSEKIGSTYFDLIQQFQIIFLGNSILWVLIAIHRYISPRNTSEEVCELGRSACQVEFGLN